MKLNRTFAGPAEMPATIPLFPLAGALLLPRRPIQLTVFEPRYLEMLDDALSGERLIGVIQPSVDEETADPAPELYPLGCAGRIVQYAEIGDGRCFLTLMGVARFHMAAEAPSQGPYRIAIADYSRFAEDFHDAIRTSLQATDGAEQRGFPRAVGADQAQQMTGGEGEADVVDGGKPVETNEKGIGLNDEIVARRRRR